MPVFYFLAYGNTTHAMPIIDKCPEVIAISKGANKLNDRKA